MPVGVYASRFAAVGHHPHVLSRPRTQLQPGMHDEGTSGPYELREVGEALEIVLLVAVDVEMVRVGRCDHGYVG